MADLNFTGWHGFAVPAFIVVVLAAQAATLAVTSTRATFPRGRAYPILDYPMYGPAHLEGERVSVSRLLEGVFADGKTIDISSDRLHADVFDFVNIVWIALLSVCMPWAAARRLASSDVAVDAVSEISTAPRARP